MKNIIDIQSENQLTNVNNKLKIDGGLVIYYSPMCGYCNAMNPELEKLDEELNNYNIEKVISKVSPEYADKIHTKNIDIIGVPTLLVVK